MKLLYRNFANCSVHLKKYTLYSKWWPLCERFQYLLTITKTQQFKFFSKLKVSNRFWPKQTDF